ncbi:GH19584, partial [Drosophila grimshawi]
NLTISVGFLNRYYTYDSSGQLSCVICRIPIKQSVWKVHLNSKQHKQNLELAKRQRIESDAKNSDTLSSANSEQIPPKAKPVVSESIAQNSDVKLQTGGSSEAAPQVVQLNTPQVLPEKFFDQEKSVTVAGSDRDLETEWIKFQREIREAATISNNIVSEEQDSLNNKRHLKEIDEQIENWKRFIKINDRKNCIFKKQRSEKRPLEFVDVASSSEEECSVDDLLDWRIKSVHK